MLRNLGYFRGIECPAIVQGGSCQRPYCHFRHSCTVKKDNYKSDSDATIQTDDQDINYLDDEFEQVSTSSVGECERSQQRCLHTSKNFSNNSDISNESVPYTPHKAADLYKPFVQDSISPKTVDYSKLHCATSSKKSVLHGARGAATTRQNKIKYSVISSSKPLNDLEYDPLCNYNLKNKSAKEKSSHNSSVVIADESADTLENELPDTDLVIDYDTATISHDDTATIPYDVKASTYLSVNSQNINNQQSSLDSLPASKAVYIDDSTDIAQREIESLDKRRSVAHILASDGNVSSDSDVVITAVIPGKKVKTIPTNAVDSVKNINKTNKIVPKSKVTGKNILSAVVKKKVITSDDLFGTDSDSDSKKVKIKKLRNKTPSKLTLKHKIPAGSTDKSNTSISSTKSMKVKSKINMSSTLEKKKTPENTRSSKRKLNEKTLVKRKKLKIVRPAADNAVDISKYVDKEEIDKLDKELNDVGMYDECFRIYQESFDGNKIEKNVTSTKPTSKHEVHMKNDVDTQKTEEVFVSAAQKPRRIAHATATDSASLLNRDRKKVQRRLTPAQVMIRRLEKIQQEQEDQMIQSTIQGLKKLKGNTSLNNKSKGSSRLAHQPSSALMGTSLSSSKKSILELKSSSGQYISAKKQPFQDLKRSPSSSTIQGTVSKGCNRIAHTPAARDDNIPERPKILPDRFSKVPTNIRQRYLTVFIDECLRILSNDHSKAYEMAKMEEKECSSRSKSKTVYLSLAASTMKKLRAMKCDSTANTSQSDQKKNPKQPDRSDVTKVAFKTNTIRISHGASHAEADKLKRAKAVDAANKKTTLTNKKRISHKNILDRTNPTCKGGYTIMEKDKERKISGEELYEALCHYIMTEEQLAENGFPRKGDYPGICSFKIELPKLNKDRTRKTCARCGKEFVLYKSGRFARTDEECIHHWGRAYSTKVGSTWEKRYSCCQTPIGTEGCSVGETHVHRENIYECNNYMKTLWKESLNSDPGVYALDCEMAYTVEGFELIRVSVVDFDCKLVYDTLVQPSGKVLDYNSRWSGLEETDLRGVTTTLRDVQAVFLSKFSSDTIFLGHSLESDLKALRIIHSTVIDTSVVFPHRLGPPYKRALRHLMAEHLGIIIQNSADEGHDSTEDATACVKLMKWKLSEDMKVSR